MTALSLNIKYFVGMIVTFVTAPLGKVIPASCSYFF